MHLLLNAPGILFVALVCWITLYISNTLLLFLLLIGFEPPISPPWMLPSCGRWSLNILTLLVDGWLGRLVMPDLLELDKVCGLVEYTLFASLLIWYIIWLNVDMFICTRSIYRMLFHYLIRLGLQLLILIYLWERLSSGIIISLVWRIVCSTSLTYQTLFYGLKIPKVGPILQDGLPGAQRIRSCSTSGLVVLQYLEAFMPAQNQYLI